MNSSNESLDNLKHERYSNILKRRRQCLYALQWFFLSGLFTLTPFLYSTHATELGLSTLERTWIHMFSSLILTLVCTIAIHRNLHTKLLLHFRPLLVTFLIVATLSHVALLFVPRTQRIARYPKITLNCSTSQSLLRIELCPNLIRSESLLSHSSAVPFHSRISSAYSSFQCDQLLRTGLSGGFLSKPNANYLDNSGSQSFYRDQTYRESNYNNEFTTFSMTKCKGVCPNDFVTKYEANKEQLLRYYERSSIKNHHRTQSVYKAPKSYSGVMDSEYDIFSGRTQICFRKSSDSKNCYTPDPDSIEPLQSNFQTNNYIQNIINFPALNSTIYRVKQIRFHSKIQSWQSVSTFPQSGDLMYPYPSCLFSQSVPVFMDGQSFESIICPNPLENTRYSKGTDGQQRSSQEDINSGAYYELNPLERTNGDSSLYQTNCDTICNTNLIYRGQFNGKYFGHHSMQLPHSPIVCHDIIGDPLLTFYSYLLIRCIADLSLMICFLTIDGLGVYYSANFDTIYGGLQKAITLGTSSSIWPVVSGLLIDYFSSSISGKPDYSAAFVLFVGLMLIGCSLVVSLQIAPSANEFNYMKHNYNLSNTFISDLCGSNLNCDKLDKEHKHSTLYSSRPELNQLIKVSFKSKLLLVLIVPFITLLGFYFSLAQLQINTYYMSLGASKSMIGLATALGYLVSMVFILIIKPLLAAVGRLNLIVLGFIFYSLQMAGNSLLSSNVKWSLLPFNLMLVFSFVLSWIGCTSHLHHLMKLNRMGHVRLQLCIGLIKFGYGRILASVIWFFWYYYYDQLHKYWPIRYFEIEEFDNRPINRIELMHEMNVFRVFIRILSLFALVFAIVFFVFYQMLSKCEQVNCKWYRTRRSNRKNRNLVKEDDDDDLGINMEEETDSLKKEVTTKTNKDTEMKFKQPNGKSGGKIKPAKDGKFNRSNANDKKKVYLSLSFFQSNCDKQEEKKTKEVKKTNKRKSAPANTIDHRVKVDKVEKKKITEEMV